MTSEMREAAGETSEPEVELLLASASAIQRLIAERQALRDRVAMLEHELRSVRQQTTLVHHSYRKLTDEFVTQFKLIDSAVSNLFGEPGEASEDLPDQSSDSDRSSAAA